MDIGPLKNVSAKSIAIFAALTVLLTALLWGVMGYQQNSFGLSGGVSVAPSMDYPGVVAQNARMGVVTKNIVIEDGGDYYAPEMASDAMYPMPVPGPIPSSAPAGVSKIIKNGDLTLQVESVDAAQRQIAAVRVKYGGQIGNESFSEYNSSRVGDVTIWVPSEHFDAAMSDIKAGALRVMNERVSVSDVSAQFVDLEARVKNLRASEAQLVTLMARSGKVSEVLQVARELSNTRGQIEQMQGQLNYLSRQVALSSIHISLSEEVVAPLAKNEWRPVSVVRAAWRDMLRDLTGLIDIILILVVRLPIFLLTIAFWCALAYGVWYAGRALYRKLHA